MTIWEAERKIGSNGFIFPVNPLQHDKEIGSGGKRGLTLIELLVVIGIIAVLAGILWVVLAPARERARKMHCVSNMKQIHLALEAYRQDWDGMDVEVANTFADLALPPKPFQMVGEWPYMEVKCLIGTPEIWWCPTGQRLYGYAVSFNEEIRKFLESVLRKRRGEYPVVFDAYHNILHRGRGGIVNPADVDEDFLKKLYSREVIVLRLNGKIDIKRVFRQSSWEW